MAPLSWILLVEDEPDHRLLVREAFARLSLPVEFHEAGDADEAERWVRDRHAAAGVLSDGIVILDLGLPGPSGFTFLEWVRSDSAFDGLPVVVLTASENPMDAEHAFNLGAKGYFQKPADFRNYVQIFERVLKIQAAAKGTGEG